MIDSIAPPGTVTGAATSVGRAELGAARGPAATGNTETDVDFGTMLMQLTSHAAGVIRHAESTSIAGIQGRASVQQVVEAVMNAEQTLQGAMAIRDKVVAAYLELSRMQI
jgi:flagellar hook-basal body complex protein FliE